MSENCINLFETQLILPHDSIEVLNDVLSCGIILVADDEFLTIKNANRGFFDLLGFSREEVFQNYANKCLHLIHPADSGQLTNLSFHLPADSDFYQCHIRIICKKEEYIWAQLSCRRRILSDNQRFFLLALCDISESLSTIARLQDDMDKQKQFMQELKHRAQQDSLTKLYNKAELQMRIERCLAETPLLRRDALLVIDIDNFKQINDTFGHCMGDSVLITIADCLKGIFRDSDIIGRVGGDEFIVFMQNIKDSIGVCEKASEICSSIRQYFITEHIVCDISCSIGIALKPEHGLRFTDLYQNADTALYSAKRSGKNRYTVFLPAGELKSE